MDEIKIGFNQLLDQFGDQFIPVFVPPWGNISMEVKQILLSQVFIEHKGNRVGVGSGFSKEQRKYYNDNSTAK